LALLQEKKIPLPSNEANLYKKRFELLSGHFDIQKEIKRVHNTPEILLNVARHLAFHIHKNKKRDITQEQLDFFLKNNYKAIETNKLKEDLITHSEILLTNPDSSLSFGHLRFQEYLTSEHLVLVRDLKIRQMLINSWWRDVFFLYAQHAFEIKWIITQAGQNGYLNQVKEVVKAMIEQRPDGEKEELKKLYRSTLTTELDTW